MATVLLALEHGEPLDAVIYVEVMYDHDRGISGESPEHIRWVREVGIPRLEEMGVRVIHLRSDVDYLGCFHREIVSGKHIGKIRAFPIARMCCIQRECKISPIRKWYREGYLKEGYDIVEYVGIAIDEVERIGRLEKSDSPRLRKESLLVKYGYTETMALLKCAEYGLLSPICTDGKGRNGCWFCPNQGYSEFYMLREGHPELWRELRKLDKVGNKCSELFKYDKTLSDIEAGMDEWGDKYGKYLTKETIK